MSSAVHFESPFPSRFQDQQRPFRCDELLDELVWMAYVRCEAEPSPGRLERASEANRCPFAFAPSVVHPCRMQWDAATYCPLHDLQDFIRGNVPPVRPALLVPTDAAEERHAELRRMFADGRMALPRAKMLTDFEVQYAISPRTIRVPIDQFGESVMVGCLRAQAEEATTRLRWRF